MTNFPASQHEFELNKFIEFYKEIKPLRTLEIGTLSGTTFYHLLKEAPEGALVVSLDSYNPREYPDNREFYREWCGKGVDYRVIVGISQEKETIEQARQFAAYDLIFIDAGHAFNEVKADWENYRPMAREGGVVAFHDIIPGHQKDFPMDVHLVWNQIKLGYSTMEIVEDYGAEWGGIGIVYL